MFVIHRYVGSNPVERFTAEDSWSKTERAIAFFARRNAETIMYKESVWLLKQTKQEFSFAVVDLNGPTIVAKVKVDNRA